MPSWRRTATSSAPSRNVSDPVGPAKTVPKRRASREAPSPLRPFRRAAGGHWRETRRERNVPLRPDAFRHSSEYSYPLNTIGKNEAMAALLAETASSRVFGLGRWGEWQHYNTDVVVERALALAQRLAS